MVGSRKRARPPRPVGQGLDDAGDDADLLLQAEGPGIGHGRILEGEQHGGAHGRVAGEGQFPGRG